jgi:hypothetical protein
MKNLGHYWKAIVAGLAPVWAAVHSAITKTEPGEPVITVAERWLIIGALMVLLGVFAKSNDPKGA